MTPPNVSSAAVREFNLEPRQTKTLELQDLQGDPALRNSFLVTSDAAPGEVVASMASTAADDKAEVHLLGKDAARTENAGVHPWSVAQGDESTLLLFNHSDQQQRMVVSIIAGKSVWRKRITLSPLETITVNINDLIKNKLEDDQHKTLPSGLLEGEIQWSMANEKTITGRLLVSNKIAGMARNFSCMTWYVLCNGASIIPSSVTLTDGDSEIFTAVYQTCTANNIGDCFGSSAGGGVSPNYGWGWSGGMSSSCGGASTCMATATAAGSQSVTATVSTTYCSFNATSQVTVTPPTATITVNFKGSKSAGDNLTFPSNRTCSQNLDLHNCPSAGTWVWNVEGNATVSDDASKWTITQSYTGRKKGYYKAANGKLVSFDNNLNVSDDNPTGFVQQPSGQKSIFWIDAPGHGYLYDNGRPIDSITQVQNFTSTVCSTTSSNDCKSVTWYFKLVVKPGAILDTANSVASFGSASTNF